MALPGLLGVPFEVNSLAEGSVLNQQRNNFPRNGSGAVDDHHWGKVWCLMGRKKKQAG